MSCNRNTVHTYKFLHYLVQLRWTGKSWQVRVFNDKHVCISSRVFAREEAAHAYINKWSGEK